MANTKLEKTLFAGSDAYGRGFNNIVLANNNLDYTTTSIPSNNLLQGLQFADKNNQTVGVIDFGQVTDTGNIRGGINLYRKVNNVVKSNRLIMQIDSEGTSKVWSSNPEAWRAGIEAVYKNGDTMTGRLTMASNEWNPLLLKRTDIDATINPSSQLENSIVFKDKNDVQYAYVASFQDSGGNLGLSLNACRMTGTRVDNAITLMVNKDGTRDLRISDSALWRARLNAVSKSGDTLSNLYTIVSGNIRLVNTTMDYASSSIGNSNVSNSYSIFDKNSHRTASFSCYQYSDGPLMACMEAIKKIGSTEYVNYLYLKINNDGSFTIQIPSTAKAAWRTAIGALSTEGGTITGNLYMTSGVYSKDNNMDVALTSGNAYEKGYNILDKNGKTVGFYHSSTISDGRVQSIVCARNYNSSGTAVSHYLQLLIDKNGNPSVLLSTGAWTAALLKTDNTQLSTNIDLNNITTPGFYRLISSNTYPHSPLTGIYGLLIVITAGSTVIYQMIYAPDGTQNIYTRYNAGSGFGSWRKFAGTAV